MKSVILWSCLASIAAENISPVKLTPKTSSNINNARYRNFQLRLVLFHLEKSGYHVFFDAVYAAFIQAKEPGSCIYRISVRQLGPDFANRPHLSDNVRSQKSLSKKGARILSTSMQKSTKQHRMSISALEAFIVVYVYFNSFLQTECDWLCGRSQFIDDQDVEVIIETEAVMDDTHYAECDIETG